VSVASPAELVASLASGNSAALLGTVESDWIEFKSAPYHLESLRQKWELAKDALALANAEGGLLVIGVATEPATDQPGDRASEVTPVHRESVSVERYLDVLAEWCEPPLRGVRIQWFAVEGEHGIYVLEVPARPRRDSLGLLNRTIGEDDQLVTAFAIPVREGGRVVMLRVQEVHRLIADGILARQRPAWSVADGLESADQIVTRIEEEQEWQELPTYFLQAIPPPGMGRLADIFSAAGPRYALEHLDNLRPQGFGFDANNSTELLEGSVVHLRNPSKAIWLEPDGRFTAGITIHYLAWAMDQYTAGLADGQTRLNALALVEFTFEFCRFFAAHVLPVAPLENGWTGRVLCRRFQSSGLVLSRGAAPRGLGFPTYRTLASSDAWDESVLLTGQPGIDALNLLERVYAMSGHKARAASVSLGVDFEIAPLHKYADCADRKLQVRRC
jgi:hypothetical protein